MTKHRILQYLKKSEILSPLRLPYISNTSIQNWYSFTHVSAKISSENDLKEINKHLKIHTQIHYTHTCTNNIYTTDVRPWGIYHIIAGFSLSEKRSLKYVGRH